MISVITGIADNYSITFEFGVEQKQFWSKYESPKKKNYDFFIIEIITIWI